MPITVFAIVLFGAALHATWNAVIKGAGDKLLTMIMVTAGAGLLAALLLPGLRQPHPASWPFLITSVFFQIVYLVLVVRAYHTAEMSLAYPLMRGSAPMLIAAFGMLWIGERMPVIALVGIALICLGILGMASRYGDGRGIALALLNGIVIACYTLVDGVGVRCSGAPAAYTLWIFLLTAIPFAFWAILRKRSAFIRHLRGNWRFGIIGGIGSITSYGLALWAMTVAPVALVAALRETSILFGMAISALVLNERPGRIRVAAACLVALGAVILRLA